MSNIEITKEEIEVAMAAMHCLKNSPLKAVSESLLDKFHVVYESQLNQPQIPMLEMMG